jgi:hypothetical protein
MIVLSDTTQSIDFTMTAIVTNPLDLQTCYVDITTTSFTPTGFQGSGSSGTFTFVSAPAASTQRQIKYLSVYNNDTVANTFSFSQNTSGTRRKLIACTLQIGETLTYMSDVGWTVYSSTGRALSTAGDVVGPTGATDNAIVRFDATTGKLVQNSLVTVDDSGNVAIPALATVDGLDPSTISIENSHAHGFIKSMLPAIAPALTTSGTAYFVYLGQVKTAITPVFVSIPVTTAGAGGQTAECGFFSTPLAPTGGGQNLTKLVATGTVDSLLATGRKGNSVSFATVVAAGTHLWVGVRIVMVTTQPQIFGLTADYGSGAVLTLAGSGALTGAGPFAGSIPAFATTLTWLVPDLRMIL